MPGKIDDVTEQVDFIFELKRAEFSKQAQKLYRDLEFLRDQIEKYLRLSEGEEGETRQYLEKIMTQLGKNMRYIKKNLSKIHYKR